MKLKVEIKMDAAAFSPDNGEEAARILRELADEMDGNHYETNWLILLWDRNGNTVGKAVVGK